MVCQDACGTCAASPAIDRCFRTAADAQPATVTKNRPQGVTSAIGLQQVCALTSKVHRAKSACTDRRCLLTRLWLGFVMLHRFVQSKAHTTTC